MSSFTDEEELAPAPSQLALDLQPALLTIDKIASDHGLSNDSGVSFGMSSRKRIALAARQSMSESSSSSSLKRAGAITDEVRRKHQVTESPTATSAFDAREEVWRDVARRVKPFGDVLRQERLRTALGETELAEQCISILHYSRSADLEGKAVQDAQVEVFRTLANLCIDHDENRTRVLEKKGPQAVIRFLQSIVSSDLQEFPLSLVSLVRTATGALLNMQLDHVQVRQVLRQDQTAMLTLLQLATDKRIYTIGEWYSASISSKREGKRHVSSGASIAAWAWRIVQDLCAGDAKESAHTVEEKKVVDEESERTIEGLIAIGADTAAKCLVKPLKPFTVSGEQTALGKGPWSSEDVSDLMESDMEVVLTACELLETCSLDSKSFRLSSLQETLAFLMQYLDVGTAPAAWSTDREEDEQLPPKPSDTESAKDIHRAFARSKAAVAKAIVCIAGEDENMIQLFAAKDSWFMNTMKEWMSRDPQKRDDLVSTAMLAMGNLARKDSHCLALVHSHNLVPTLTALLTPKADIKVAHGIVCLLKNLSIPADNKGVIANEHQTMPALMPYLSSSMDHVQPLQFATVGLLKHLCAGCLENALDLAGKNDLMGPLLQLIQRTEDVPIRMEGTRVLVNVTKTIWSSQQNENRTEAKRRLVSAPVTLALAEMVRSSPKYPVLVNEGILAMTLIASEHQTNGAALVAAALLSDPESEAINALNNISGDDAGKGESRLEKPRNRGPSRKATMDSLASQNSQTLPAPRTSADMIANVLARRDARMPPQFASNACIFVQTLVDGCRQNGFVKSEGTQAICQVLQSWQGALQRLSEVGPQETLSLASQSLQSTNSLLASL